MAEWNLRAITALVAELEEAVTALRPPSESAFMILPEDREQAAYRRGARDAYLIVIKALKKTPGEG